MSRHRRRTDAPRAPGPIFLLGDGLLLYLGLAGTVLSWTTAYGLGGQWGLITKAIAKEHFDYIIIDCPPSLGLLTLNALTAADYIIIPVQAQYLAMRGMAKLMDIIRIVQERLNSNLKVGGIVITQFDRRKTLNRSVREIVNDSFHEKVFKTVIRDNVALAEAPINGKTIFEYNPKSNGASDYMSLAKEVLNLK